MFLVRLFEIDPFDSMTCMLLLHILLPVFYTAVEEPLRSLAVDLDQWTDRKIAQWDIDLMKTRHFGPKLTLLEFNNSISSQTQPKNAFFLKLCPIRKRNLFFIFCKLWKLYSSKVILWNEEEGIICLNDEVERCPKDSIIKYFQLSYRYARKRPTFSKFIFWIKRIRYKLYR